MGRIPSAGRPLGWARIGGLLAVAWLMLGSAAQAAEPPRHRWVREFYGRFEESEVLLHNSSAFFGKLTFGDLDGDGDADLLLGKEDGRIDRFENKGRPGRPVWRLVQENISALQAAQPGGQELASVLISAGNHAAPALVDIDADGDLDLFVGTGDGRLMFFRNIGNPVLPAFALVSEQFVSPGFGNNLVPFFADVDRNRTPDLLIGNGEGEVFLLVNQGDRKRAAFCVDFPPPDALPDEEPPCRPVPQRVLSIAPETSAAPALSDWDRDDDLDLFVGKSDGTIAYFENKGTPFAPEWRLAQARFLAIDQGGFAAPAFIDMNGDGQGDLVIGSSTNNVSFYTNKDTGKVMDVWKVSDNVLGIRRPGRDLRQTVMAPGDLDGDGDLDLLIGDRGGRLVWLENAGTAEVPAWRLRRENLLAGAARENAAPWLADLDGDGDLDLLLGGLDGRLWLLRNTGTAKAPQFVLESSNFAGVDVGNDSVPTLVDIDGDGDLDLFVGNRRGLVIFYRNEGSAGAPDFRLASTQFGGMTAPLSAAPSFFDWDGDKRPDLVLGGRNGRLLLSVNKNPPQDPDEKSWERQGDAWEPFQANGYSAPVLADLNHDGRPDLLIGDGDGNFQLWWNMGAAVPAAAAAASPRVGTEEAPQLSGAPPGEQPVAGVPLAPVVQSQSGLTALAESAAPAPAEESPAAALLAPQPPPGPLFPLYTLASEKFGELAFEGRVSPSFGDIDGDGDLDMVVGTSKGLLFLFRNEGSKEAPAWKQVTDKLAGYSGRGTPSPLLTDLDGDGKVDLVVGTEDGRLLFYRNSGEKNDAPFALQEGALAVVNVGRNAAPAAALLNDDPSPDLLVGNFAGQLLAYLRQGGAQSLNFTLSDRRYLNVDVGVSATPFVGDLDRDDNPDLLIGSDQGNLSLYTRVPPERKNPWGWGPGPDFLKGLKFPFGTSPRLADIDGDGDMDLLVGTEKGAIYFFRNDALHPPTGSTQ